MSSARRFSLVVLLASALVALNAAAANAQAGPPNPSGGTSLRQTTLEGGSSSPAGILSRDLSFQTGWHNWFGAFTASRYAPSVAAWTSDGRSLSAVARRPVGRR